VEPQRAVEQAHRVQLERPRLIVFETHTDETPRAALARLSRRINLVVIVVLVLLSVLAWQSAVEQANSMSGMVMGLGQIGALAQGDMGAGLFLTMWATMMVAMMLPIVAPMVLAHLAVTRRRGNGILPTLAFASGYFLVWSAIGVAPMLAYWAFAGLSDEAGSSRWLTVLGGTILIVAGAYQFTAWKQLCLDKCQSPFGFLAHHDFGGGASGALRAGVVHGAYCLGCCWALMAVLLVVGLMNLLWMAGIFVLVFVEKHWKHGIVLAKVAGAALMILGVAIIAWPALLALISR
jgi:predicted metal-binding membrane protein